MAAVTTAAIGLATAGAQIWSSASEKKSAKNALNNLQEPEDINAAENVSINTRGYDYAREDNARGLATGVNELRSSGIRGLSAVPKLLDEFNNRSEEIAIGLTKLDLDRQYKIADRANALNDADKKQYNEDVIGLNNRIASANQNMWSGIMGAGSSLSSMASALDPKMGGGTQKNYDFGSGYTGPMTLERKYP